MSNVMTEPGNLETEDIRRVNIEFGLILLKAPAILSSKEGSSV
jgi:hypothetical protein